MSEADYIQETNPELETEVMVSTKDSKKFFAKNTVSNIIYFIFNVLTSMYMVPYQIRNLGIANYGMIALVSSFIQYISVGTIAITGATSRFVTFQAAKNDLSGARGYFSTQFIATMWLTAILFPICMIISLLVPKFAVIPPGQERNTQLLSVSILLGFLIMLIGGSFRTSLVVRQRFDIANFLDIVNQVCRYSIWIIMFTLFIPSLWHIGLGILLGAVVSFIGSWIFFWRLTPELAPDLHGFDSRKFAETIKFGGWMVVIQVGILLYLQTDALIINRMLGPTEGGKYATLLGFSMQLRSMTSMLITVLSPAMIAAYARQDTEGLLKNSARAVKFLSLALAIPLALLCGLSIPFLTWWLGPEFKSLNVLVWLMFSHLVLNLGVQPLGAIIGAANKLAVPGIAVVIGGVFNVGLAIAIVKYTNLGIRGVALAGLISLTLKNGIFTPIYSSIALGIPSRAFYKALAPPVFVFALTAIAGLGLSHSFELSTFPKLAGSGLAISGLSALATYRFALNNDDRRFLAEVLPISKIRIVK